jgi:hypothetical protein
VNTSLLLRIASIITLLFAVGHSMGAPWTPVNASAPAAVVEAMKSVRFDALGSSRTYWEFYFGFGVSISIYLFMQAAVLWFLATIARNQPSAVRPIVVVLLLGYSANVYVTWRYFFIVPLVLSIVMAACLALTLVASRSRAGG